MKPRSITWLTALPILAGCASTIPDTIRTAPQPDVQLSEARSNPQAARGATVRWGGHIVGVQNSADETHIEIVSRRLDGEGEPLREDVSDGRFLARVKGFVDPAIYAAGRALTVRGQVEGVLDRAIGEYRYRYVVVKAEQTYLWPPRVPPAPYRYPYYYRDPTWWDPWYPWGPPYYYRPPPPGIVPPR